MGGFQEGNSGFSSSSFFYEKKVKNLLCLPSVSNLPYHSQYHSDSFPRRGYNVHMRRAVNRSPKGERTSGGGPLFSFEKRSSAIPYAKTKENTTFPQKKDGRAFQHRNGFCSLVPTSLRHTVMPVFSSGGCASVPHHSRGHSEPLSPYSSSSHAPCTSAVDRVWRRFSSTEKDRLSFSSTVIRDRDVRSEERWIEEENHTKNHNDLTIFKGDEGERKKCGEKTHGEDGNEGKETVYGIGGVQATVRNVMKPSFQYSSGVPAPAPAPLTRSVQPIAVPWPPPPPPSGLSAEGMKSSVERCPLPPRVLPSEGRTPCSSSSPSPAVSLPPSSAPTPLSHRHRPLRDAPMAACIPSLVVCPAWEVETKRETATNEEKEKNETKGVRQHTRSHERWHNASSGMRGTGREYYSSSYRSPSGGSFISSPTSQYGEEGKEKGMVSTAWNVEDSRRRIQEAKEMGEGAPPKYLLSPPTVPSVVELPRRPAPSPPPPPTSPYTTSRRRRRRRGSGEEAFHTVGEGNTMEMKRLSSARDGEGETVTNTRSEGRRRCSSPAMVLLPPPPSTSSSSSPCASSSSVVLPSYSCSSSPSSKGEINEGQEETKNQEDSFFSFPVPSERTQANDVVSLVSEWLRQERRRRRREISLPFLTEDEKEKRDHQDHPRHRRREDRKGRAGRTEALVPATALHHGSYAQVHREKKQVNVAAHVGEERAHAAWQERTDGRDGMAYTAEQENRPRDERKRMEHRRRRDSAVERREKTRRNRASNGGGTHTKNDPDFLFPLAQKEEKMSGKEEIDKLAVHVITIGERERDEQDGEKREKTTTATTKRRDTEREPKARGVEESDRALQFSPSFDFLSFSSSTSHERSHSSSRSPPRRTSMSSSDSVNFRRHPLPKRRIPSNRRKLSDTMHSTPSSEPKLLRHTLKITQIPEQTVQKSYSSTFSTGSTAAIQGTSEVLTMSPIHMSLLTSSAFVVSEKSEGSGNDILLASARPPPLSAYQLSQPLFSSEASSTLPGIAFASSVEEEKKAMPDSSAAFTQEFDHTAVLHIGQEAPPEDGREKNTTDDAKARRHVKKMKSVSQTVVRRTYHSIHSHVHSPPHAILSTTMPTSLPTSTSHPRDGPSSFSPPVAVVFGAAGQSASVDPLPSDGSVLSRGSSPAPQHSPPPLGLSTGESPKSWRPADRHPSIRTSSTSPSFRSGVRQSSRASGVGQSDSAIRLLHASGSGQGSSIHRHTSFGSGLQPPLSPSPSFWSLKERQGREESSGKVEEEEKERRRPSMSSLGGIEMSRTSRSVSSTSGCNPVIFSPFRPSWVGMLPGDKRKIQEKLRQASFGRPPSMLLSEDEHRSSVPSPSSPRHSISTVTHGEKKETTRDDHHHKEKSRHESGTKMAGTSMEGSKRGTTESSRRRHSTVAESSPPSASLVMSTTTTSTYGDTHRVGEEKDREGERGDSTGRPRFLPSSASPSASRTKAVGIVPNDPPRPSPHIVPVLPDTTRTITPCDTISPAVPLALSPTAAAAAAAVSHEHHDKRPPEAGADEATHLSDAIDLSPRAERREDGVGGSGRARPFAAAASPFRTTSISSVSEGDARRKCRSGRGDSTANSIGSSRSAAERPCRSPRTTSSLPMHQGTRLSRLRKQFPLPPGAVREYQQEKKRWEMEEKKAHDLRYQTSAKEAADGSGIHHAGNPRMENAKAKHPHDKDDDGAVPAHENAEERASHLFSSLFSHPSHASGLSRRSSSASPVKGSPLRLAKALYTATGGSDVHHPGSPVEDAPTSEDDEEVHPRQRALSSVRDEKAMHDEGDERRVEDHVESPTRRGNSASGHVVGPFSRPSSRRPPHHHTHHPHLHSRPLEDYPFVPPPVPLVHVSTTYDLPTSIRILILGDLFFLLSHPFMPGRSFFASRFSYEPRTTAKPRFVWVDTKSYLLVWGKPGEWQETTPAYRRTLFRKSIRLEKISHIGCSSFTRLPDGTSAGDRQHHYPVSLQQYYRANYPPSHPHAGGPSALPYRPLPQPRHARDTTDSRGNEASRSGSKWGVRAGLSFTGQDEERSPRPTNNVGSQASPVERRGGTAGAADPGDPSWLEPVGTTYYVLSIQTPKRSIQLSTVSQRKADTWYDALHNVCEFVRRTSLSHRAEIPD